MPTKRGRTARPSSAASAIASSAGIAMPPTIAAT
jgi:hypothetical protein